MHRMWSSGKAVWRVGNSHTDWIKTAFFPLWNLLWQQAEHGAHCSRSVFSEDSGKFGNLLGAFHSSHTDGTRHLSPTSTPIIVSMLSKLCEMRRVLLWLPFCDSKMDWLGDAFLVPHNRVMLRVRQGSWSTRLYPILHLPSWCWSNCIAC